MKQLINDLMLKAQEKYKEYLNNPTNENKKTAHEAYFNAYRYFYDFEAPEYGEGWENRANNLITEYIGVKWKSFFS
ncbi:MAG: hypothetical protein ACK5HR_06970 [Mycoplasmatales bacterium]